MIGPIQWEALAPAERAALAKAGEASPLAFMALWFNVAHGEPLQINWHHHYFDWAVRQMLDGKVQNVVINIPPGGTKTEFFSIHLPAYVFATHKRSRILNTSYSKDLVTENSERARALLKSAEFGECYPQLKMGKDKMDDWTLERGGRRVHQLFSRSSGGQITGVRGGFIRPGYSGHVQADDWDKPDEMFSAIRRNRSHMRLTNTLRSRRACSTTPFLFVQQRLHAEDSTWYLTQGKMGLTVDLHVTIPAVVDSDYIMGLPDGIRERALRDVCLSESVDGKWSYWPTKDSIHDLLALRDANPYTFASQYQQDPATLSGGIFDPEDFGYYGEDDEPLPHVLEYRFITADTAQKTNTWNDWTVFAEWGVAEGKLYLLNIQRERMDAKQLRRDFETFVKRAHKDNSGTRGNLRAVLVEDKSSGTGLIQEMSGRLPVPVTPVPRERDKLTRALDVQPHHAAGKVVLPYGVAENYEFVSEVGSFAADDSHRFDDQVDVMIDAMHYVFIEPHVGGTGTAGVW